MFHILVVDDEDGERDGILYLIREFRLPLTTAETKNGTLALQYLQEHPVDILFTDIKMPFMDGLELADKARQLNSELQIIIFSAYGEFDYAKEAVKLDAFYYLLKPIVVTEFVQVMNNVIQRCTEMADKKKQEEKLLENFGKMKAYGQNKLLLDLINGSEPDDSFLERLHLLNLEFDMNHIFMIHVSFKQRFFDRNRSLMEEDFQDLTGQRYLYLNLDEYQSVIFVEWTGDSLSKAQVSGLGQRLMEWVGEQYGLPVCVVVSRPTESIRDICQEYRLMEAQTEYRFFFHDSVLLSTWKEEARPDVGEDAVQKAVENITLRLEERDDPGAEQGIKLLFEIFKNRCNSTIFCKYTCAELAKKIFEQTNNVDTADFDSILKEIFQANSLDSIRKALLELLRERKEVRGNREPKAVNKSIQRVLEYIQENYGSDIGLESIAKAVYLSPGYLSVYFKKEMGQSLTKYITCYRLEQAKNLLLHTNKKVVDIAKEVGFSDNSYFCMVFRNYYDVSPARFRERNS